MNYDSDRLINYCFNLYFFSCNEEFVRMMISNQELHTLELREMLL